MHVCHVITRLIVGGAQENTVLTCEGLHRRGHRVTLIAGPSSGPEGSLVDRVRRGGYAYIELPELIRAVNPWYDARAQRYLAMEFDRLRPDVVHTHSSKAGILGRNAAFHAGVPVIVHTVHGMSFNRTQPWWVQRLYRWLERRAARRCHAIVTVADAMQTQMVAAGVCRREKMQTIYSGMEVEAFEPAVVGGDRGVEGELSGGEDDERVRLLASSTVGIAGERDSNSGTRPGDDAIVVGTVARLFRNKGYEQLIPIMDAAARRDPRLRFFWIGDGAQRAEYEAELARRGLRERTTLVGLVSPERIPGLLAGCDIVAHASQWEGLPRVAVQALLMRVPVVAFAIDGTPEVVLDGRTGCCVPLNDETAFVEALLALAADPNLRRQMGAAGREHCVARFDWRVMVDQLEELYIRLRERGRT